jgi:hypothetical protein
MKSFLLACSSFLNQVSTGGKEKTGMLNCSRLQYSWAMEELSAIGEFCEGFKGLDYFPEPCKHQVHSNNGSGEGPASLIFYLNRCLGLQLNITVCTLYRRGFPVFLFFF